MRCFGYDDSVMRDLALLFIHLLVTISRLFGPGGARSVVAESLLVKHQLLILNRSRARAPDLRPTDRLIAGLCATFMRPTRLLRSAIVLRPSTILSFHRALVKRKYRLIFTPKNRAPGRDPRTAGRTPAGKGRRNRRTGRPKPTAPTPRSRSFERASSPLSMDRPDAGPGFTVHLPFGRNTSTTSGSPSR